MGNICSFSLSCDALFSRCLDCSISKAAYISELKENLDALQTELQKLIEARNDVMTKVTIAEQQRKKRTDQVQGWLVRVQDIVAEIGELQKLKPQEMKKLCLGGYCSTDCKSSYEFGKRVADMLKAVTDLRAEAVFQDVAQEVAEDPVDVLQNELQKLIAASKDVENRVTIAEQQRKQPTEKVKLWLSGVQAIEVKVAELQELKSQVCLEGSMSSIEFRRSVADAQKVVTDLVAQGVFQEVARDIPEDPVDEKPTDPNIVGQQSIFNEVWSCLNQERVRIVGLYGPGGVGKTTLLKQINNSFLDNEAHHLDVVIWTVVSKNHKPEGIQDQIWKKIGFSEESWSRKNLEEKAQDIFKILRKKKFLLLLDDIWERVDLIKLGVPHSNPKSTSQVVFTTRSFAVCRQMEVDKEFEVKCLYPKEAWELFQKKVGRDILSCHPEIPKLAEIVAKECRGLPLALSTVGRAMACKKTLEEWKDAVEVLRTSAFEFPGLGNEVYPILKFSYDSLPTRKTRSCFLYCTLFQEDCRIYKSYLIDCWLAEGFLDGYDGNRAIDRGYSIIGDLVRSCLLEEEELDTVVMHDVIRDMALWIACEIEKTEENFLVQAGTRLSKAPEIGKWEGVKRISLMENKIENLSETPTCPNLLTLFLGFNHLSVITNDFFQFMPCLRVLSLAYNDSLKELPSGISNLVSLQHLDLTRTGLEMLPEELKTLVNLKYLRLAETFYVSRFPRKILSSLLRLRTLSMSDCGIYVRATEDSILFDDGESLMEELLCLEHLNVLSITAGSARFLKKFSSFHKFQSCCERLYLRGIKASKSLNFSFLADMKHLRSLSIFCCDFELVEIDFTGLRQFHAFHSLREVVVRYCCELKDMTWLILAPNLKRIEISNCQGVEEIINVEKLIDIREMCGNLIPFSVLEYLELDEVPKLKSIYPDSLPFFHLKKIEVYGCPMLTKLPLNSSSTKERKTVIKGQTCWWEKLQWEDEVTQNVFGSCFEIHEDDCDDEDDEH